MEWIIVVLTLIVVLFIALYWKSVREGNQLTNYALLILLDDETHASQKKALSDLVHGIDAKNSSQLGGRVNLLLVRLAERFGGSMLRVVELLWQLKNAPIATSLATAKKTAPPKEDGATPDTAIRISAANSLEGIPKEYAALGTMFGVRNKDWKVIERSFIHANDGRKLEKFIVSAANQRKEVYFDITDFMRGNDEKAKTALDNLIASRDRTLEVLLPKEEFMTLHGGLLRLTDAQLKQLGLSAQDRKQMFDPLSAALLQFKGVEYTSIPDHISVTTMTSVWTRILGVLKSWEPSSLLLEEEIENLKAIIGGTMKSAKGPSE
jgi:hypothetical protein